MAWIREQGWGPAQSRGQQRRAWGELRRAGIADPPDWLSELAQKEAERDRRLLLRPEASQLHPQLSRAQARTHPPSRGLAAQTRAGLSTVVLPTLYDTALVAH
eukprot:3220034-Alexandrium_andersonii.AAC.1